MESRKIFTRFECELLLELVKKYEHVIESKETNKVTSIKKNEAFMAIEKEFNATIGVTRRSAIQLRQKYLNIKKKAVKSSAEVRREIRMTCGSDSQKKN